MDGPNVASRHLEGKLEHANMRRTLQRECCTFMLPSYKLLQKPREDANSRQRLNVTDAHSEMHGPYWTKGERQPVTQLVAK